MLYEQLSLWESLLFVFVGVAGVAFGLGVLLINRQSLISTMETRFRETADEMRSMFKRDLEVQMLRMQAQNAVELGEMASKLERAIAEGQMNAAAALTWQRRVETLERRVATGVVINAGGDVTTGGDVAGHDKTVSR